MRHALWSVLGAMCVGTVASAQSWFPPAPEGVEVTEIYGIQFSTIDHVGNVPCTEFERVPDEFEDPFLRSHYRWPFGSVRYRYRIARSEVTTEQWIEFLNAFSNTQTREWFLAIENSDFRFIADGPLTLGAYRQRTPNGIGYIWRIYSDVDFAVRVPVGPISFKQAMMYCNWLHNGRTSDWSSLMDGAYDLSQFPRIGRFFPRPIERRAGARFWIPSSDEWAKAAHFDPNRFGYEQPGYWEYSPRRSTPLIYGPAEGGGEAAAGFQYFVDYRGELLSAFVYPTSSYPEIQSAFGLLDTVGCTEEMTETLLAITPEDPNSGYFEQVVEGSNAFYTTPDGVNRYPLRSDHLGYYYASATWNGGLRLVTSAACVADFNEDGFLDFFDYDSFVWCLESAICPPGSDADFNRDGRADRTDYVDFVFSFEAGC